MSPLLSAPLARRLARTVNRALFGLPKRLYVLGWRYRCGICGRRSRRFLEYGQVPRDNCRCPWCDSLERHRFLWAYLRARTDLFDHQPRTVLHFAPEAFLEPRLRRLPRLRYLGLDYEIGRADLAGDITRLGIATGAVDGILCSHVLEHIPDDRGAMLELRRVLKPGGWGVLMVPIGGTATDEDPSVTDPAERLRRFKQHDHVRIYGLDFADRLRAAGFAVEVVLAQEVLDEEERRLQRVPGDQLLFRVERGG